MKRLFKIMIAIVLCLTFVFSAIACSNQNDGDVKTGVQVTYSEKDGGYVLYKYLPQKNVKELDLDSAVKEATKDANAKLVVIKEHAFKNTDNLEKIIIPNTVKTIEHGIFTNVKNLKEITLPFVGRTAVADAFFEQTDKGGEEKSVNEERTFAYLFGHDVYDGGSQVNVSTPVAEGEPTVTTIYMPASLQTIKINPAENYNIPMYAFYGFSADVNVELGEKVVGIGEGAFSNCVKFVEFNIPATITNIYKNAFNGCTALKVINYAGNQTAFDLIVKGEDWNKGLYEYAKIKGDGFEIDLSTND